MSLTCKTCGNTIPPMRLACPRCTADLSYQAILDQQRALIARITKGDFPLKLTKPSEEKKWHLVLAGYSQAWCGRMVNGKWKSRRFVPWPNIPTSSLCEQCQRVIEELIADEQSKGAA